jgi:signal transduction histidine kinase/purine-cytosine permease-like protein/FixJ family two-component response regulator
MATRQRILRVRRDYNQWVANQTLEDYALRFTANSARRWSALRVANTALGSVSFLALEAIGGTITIGYGFDNAVLAILVVGCLIFAAGLPISFYASRYGVDIDLLTRGAGFGYIGSTITSLIYASFTFIFFAIEAVILSSMLEMVFGLPQPIGYVICAIGVIPLVTHGITFISRFQIWTQPIWIILHVLPFIFIALSDSPSFTAWSHFRGAAQAPGVDGSSFDLLLFGSAASVVFSLIAQIGEQVDFLRFLPTPKTTAERSRWWVAMISGGPGWILVGVVKLLAGSFLASLAVGAGISPEEAARPTVMYRVAFGYVLPGAGALILMACFVAISQVKINVTNAYAGSIAWSNFFSRLTHSHPGRVVWVIFNITIALLLMELGIYRAIEHTLVIYSDVAAAWVGALVADLVVNKQLGFSPPQIEFKRAHLYDINPVGVGAMLLGISVSLAGYLGWLGLVATALSPFLAFGTAFVAAPVIAAVTGGKYYLARKPHASWAGVKSLKCVICENTFETEDMASCPAYAGAICSLCCSLDARCHDTCKVRRSPAARWRHQVVAPVQSRLPAFLRPIARGTTARFGAVMVLLTAAIGLMLFMIYHAAMTSGPDLSLVFWQAFFILAVLAGVASWLLVLGQDSRRVAEEEMRRQTALLMSEIEAHEITDAKLERAKQVAEAANHAKSRYVTGISHELRTPLNAILGYAQLLERDASLPERRRDNVRIIRRSGEHLAGLIEGLLDISKIEAGRIELYRDQVRLEEFLDQVVNMFRLQAESKGINFIFLKPERLPEVIYTDERRLRQILINLLSNAIKFTTQGRVILRLRWRGVMAEFEVEDSGVGIAEADLSRIFEPFERATTPGMLNPQGVGLGLTITKLLTQIMGGEITVTSTPGQGSRFLVRILLSEAIQDGVLHPRIATPSQALIGGYDGHRRTVVVADDDPISRGLIQDALVPLGFTVLGASDGQQCLEIAEGCEPDLFLLDLSMPYLTGWELARRLREAGHASASILIVSASAGELLTPPEGRHDHDAVLSKPISITDLLDICGRLLGVRWRADREDMSVGANASSEISDALRALPQLEELRELGAIGYVKGIRAKLDEIERDAPQTAADIVLLRGMMAEFRLDAFMAALAGNGDEPDFAESADMDVGPVE